MPSMANLDLKMHVQAPCAALSERRSSLKGEDERPSFILQMHPQAPCAKPFEERSSFKSGGGVFEVVQAVQAERSLIGHLHAPELPLEDLKCEQNRKRRVGKTRT